MLYLVSVRSPEGSSSGWVWCLGGIYIYIFISIPTSTSLPVQHPETFLYFPDTTSVNASHILLPK